MILIGNQRVDVAAVNLPATTCEGNDCNRLGITVAPAKDLPFLSQLVQIKSSKDSSNQSDVFFDFI